MQNLQYVQNEVSDCSNGIILATGGYDNNIILWQAHTGSLIFNFNHPLFVFFTWYFKCYSKLINLKFIQ